MNALTKTVDHDYLTKIFDNFFNDNFIFGNEIKLLYPQNIPETAYKYPPYNIIEENNGDRVIEFALAGFSENEIAVEQDGDTLKVSAKKTEEFPGEGPNYIRRGIALRSFERSFRVSSDFEVQEPKFKNGILSLKFINKKEPPKQLTIRSE